MYFLEILMKQMSISPSFLMNRLRHVFLSVSSLLCILSPAAWADDVSPDCQALNSRWSSGVTLMGPYPADQRVEEWGEYNLDVGEVVTWSVEGTGPINDYLNDGGYAIISLEPEVYLGTDPDDHTSDSGNLSKSGSFTTTGATYAYLGIYVQSKGGPIRSL